MKKLTKLLLVHWYYFTQELIEFDDLNFLTGKNSAGKSTIIDALQLVLLGDTSGSYFNKAASDRGDRTLKGYLRGELGDDGASGFRYLRNGRFTSYIALEFHDTEKQRYFTVGCCFDTFSDNDMQKLFFLYDGAMHPNGFLKGDLPMDITQLRTFFKENYVGHFETTEVGRDFRTKLYGKLGGLRDRFSGLLKKTVSFTPNMNIQQFITEFVCDAQQTVDVSHMQDNIRSYKRLEAESDVLKARIELLDKIVKTHQSYTTLRNNEILYSYLIDRANADIKSAELALAEEKVKNTVTTLKALDLNIAEADVHIAETREQRNTLHAQLLSDSGAQALEQLDRQIADKEAELLALQDEYERAMSDLLTQIALWRNHTETMLQKLKSAQVALLQSGITSRINDIVTEGNALREKIAAISSVNAETATEMGQAGLAALSDTVDNIKRHSIELASRMQDEQDALVKTRAELAAEQKSLESGIYRFPQDALDLKAAVASRLRTLTGRDVNVRIVAEAAEIRNDRWRNVIEGYLNSQKYYIIVPEERFKDALRVYDEIKRKNAIYNTGIVDIEKLKRQNPTANSGSLAEEVETDDADVKAFLDYTLGRVQKCDDVADLRNHRTAVTDEGMLYQNFVVRAMNPSRWAKPAIGQGAIQRRLDAVKRECVSLSEQVAVCSGVKLGLDHTVNLTLLSNSEIEKIISAAESISAIPALESDLASLRLNRAAIDTSAIDSLKKRIDILDHDIIEQEKQLRSETERQGRLKGTLEQLQDEKIPGLTAELNDKESTIATTYDKEWTAETGEPRYQRELLSRDTADNVSNAFPREQSRAKNAKDEAHETLLDLRRSYNDKYKMGLDIKAELNDAYDDAWRELTDNKLPDYLVKITDARAKAFEQFQEDFISRLQNNLNNAKRQIDDLNIALRGATFGEDTYRFRIFPKPEYRRYYDMIMDEMITEGGYNLLSMQFNAKYKDEIAELFAIITNADGTGGSSEYERRVQEFTDFRTYLSFDLEVEGRDGETQRLSKTLGKKSGGETQTPFYIAVLASFAQLYRVGRDKTHKTSRLIILDEAFSKMDGERIIRSIELLRKFEFQVIISAPPDKIGDIAALVDRNLCVIREGKRTCVRSFDKPHIEEFVDE